MTRTPKSVHNLLNSKPTLRRLQLELNAHEALLTGIRRLLPGDLAPHCVFAHLRDGQLLIHVDSAVWATRLRFFAPQLVRLVADEHPSVTEVSVRLLVDNRRQARRRPPAYRSDFAAQVVEDSATGIGDARLQAAMLRLGRRLRSR